MSVSVCVDKEEFKAQVGCNVGEVRFKLELGAVSQPSFPEVGTAADGARHDVRSGCFSCSIEVTAESIALVGWYSCQGLLCGKWEL